MTRPEARGRVAARLELAQVGRRTAVAPLISIQPVEECVMTHDLSRFRLSRRAALAATLGAAAGVQRLRIDVAASNPVVLNDPIPVRDPSEYTAYIPTASKTGPFFIYTCEFDASWAVLKTFDIDAPLEDQLGLIEIDRRIEPYYEWRDDGVLIFGGDITRAYSGDYTWNLLCRTTGGGMRPVFEYYGLEVNRANTRRRVEHFLARGRLIWIKTTVDFLDWVPATWITPEGQQLPVVLSNDHAMVVIGFDDDVVVIRDVLGPTDTNWQRPYEFEVPWDRFLACWAAQGSDGLAVGPPDA
jgi:hypothetical protein